MSKIGTFRDWLSNHEVGQKENNLNEAGDFKKAKVSPEQREINDTANNLNRAFREYTKLLKTKGANIDKIRKAMDKVFDEFEVEEKKLGFDVFEN